MRYRPSVMNYSEIPTLCSHSLYFPKFYAHLVWSLPYTYKNKPIFSQISSSLRSCFPELICHFFESWLRNLHRFTNFIVIISKFLLAFGKAWLPTPQWNFSKLNDEVVKTVPVEMPTGPMRTMTNLNSQTAVNSTRKYCSAKLILNWVEFCRTNYVLDCT